MAMKLKFLFIISGLVAALPALGYKQVFQNGTEYRTSNSVTYKSPLCRSYDETFFLEPSEIKTKESGACLLNEVRVVLHVPKKGSPKKEHNIAFLPLRPYTTLLGSGSGTWAVMPNPSGKGADTYTIKRVELGAAHK